MARVVGVVKVVLMVGVGGGGGGGGGSGERKYLHMCGSRYKYLLYVVHTIFKF